MTNPFRALHAGPDVLVLPNAWDAGSARVIEVAGAKAIATSSSAGAWAHGYPDGQVLAFDALLADLAEIRRVTSVPLSADIEAAWTGEPARAAENVMRVLDAGAAGINIEDGRDSPELLAAKIAAIKARAGDAVWVNARTDVYLKKLADGEEAYVETVARARRYLDAGADSIFIPMAPAEDLLKRFVDAIAAPINVLACAGLPPLARLEQIGIRRLSAGGGIAKLSWSHAYATAQAFLAEGRSEPFTGASPIPGGVNAIMRAH